jgi:hypothetical protein
MTWLNLDFFEVMRDGRFAPTKIDLELGYRQTSLHNTQPIGPKSFVPNEPGITSAGRK